MKNYPSHNAPRGFMPRSFIKCLVAGLRDYESPTEVKVFSANTGELLRAEKPVDYSELKANGGTKRK